MVSPILIMKSPTFPPYTCIRCGVGAGPFRNFFVDLGISNELAVDLRDHGAIYFCDQCARNLVNDLTELLTNPPVGILTDDSDRREAFAAAIAEQSNSSDDDPGSNFVAPELQGPSELSEGTDPVPSDESGDYREYVDPREDRREVIELGKPKRPTISF